MSRIYRLHNGRVQYSDGHGWTDVSSYSMGDTAGSVYAYPSIILEEEEPEPIVIECNLLPEEETE